MKHKPMNMTPGPRFLNQTQVLNPWIWPCILFRLFFFFGFDLKTADNINELRCQGPDFLERILRSMEFPGGWGLVGLKMSGCPVRLVGSKKSQDTYDMMPQHSLIHWIMGNSRSLYFDIFFLQEFVTWKIIIFGKWLPNLPLFLASEPFLVIGFVY